MMLRFFQWIISENTFESQQVQASIYNLSQSHTADMEIIKRDVDSEREKREMSFNQLSGQIDQIEQKFDQMGKNVSG